MPDSASERPGLRPVVFPYRLYGGVLCPFVELGLKGVGGEWIKAEAYADSGAFISIFTEKVAALLGLRLSAGELTHAGGVGGVQIPVYIHRLPVQIGPHKFSARIGFSDKLGVGFNLLGRIDFFPRFDFIFSDVSQRLILQPVKGKKMPGGKGILTLRKILRKRKAH